MAHRGILVMGELILESNPKRQGYHRLTQPLLMEQTTLQIDVDVSSDWEVGDSIVVASTSYDGRQAEQFEITGISSDGKTITFFSGHPSLPGAKHDHWGGPDEDYQAGASGSVLTLNQSAEVANLTRNIVIEPHESTAGELDDPSEILNGVGGHLMVMGNGFARLDGVELRRMGQAGIMGRYPVHWHERGDATLQGIWNSSIHDSYQRCVVIHDTDEVTVHENTCFDFLGHGFFLEDGTEQENVITHNIAIHSEFPSWNRYLLESERRVSQTADIFRFAPVANFWISNPYNTVTDNVAAGSVGTGFWNSFMILYPAEAMENSEPPRKLPPRRTETLAYARNVAHGAVVGQTWDGAPSYANGADFDNGRNEHDRPLTHSIYTPCETDGHDVLHFLEDPESSCPPGFLAGRSDFLCPAEVAGLGCIYLDKQVPEFEGLVVYKNVYTGFYYRGSTAVFSESVAADNGLSHFHAFHHIVQDSVIVGRSSGNSSAKLDEQLYQQRQEVRRRRDPSAIVDPEPQVGIRMYDGPFELMNVGFHGFDGTPVDYLHSDGLLYDTTSVPILGTNGDKKLRNYVAGLNFDPEPHYRAKLTQDLDHVIDRYFSNTLRDRDGTLTGTLNALVLSDAEMHRARGCLPAPSFINLEGFQVCPSTTRSMTLQLRGKSYGTKLPFNVWTTGRNAGSTWMVDPAVFPSILPITGVNSKVALVTSEDWIPVFVFDWLNGQTGSGPETEYTLTAYSETVDEMTGRFYLVDMGPNCDFVGPNAPQYRASWLDVMNETAESVYTRIPRGLVVNLKTVNPFHHITQDFPARMADDHLSEHFDIECTP
ncbi:MAG: right-handed parallel beta-helix repeat-containing protein [Acidobacteriota bacterium]